MIIVTMKVSVFTVWWKLLFTISVVKDCLVFLTKILCRDDFIWKSLCGERLLAKRDQQPRFSRHRAIYMYMYM